jgi:hypothetical protein
MVLPEVGDVDEGVAIEADVGGIVVDRRVIEVVGHLS